MKLYQLGKGVHHYYRDNVKGNESISCELTEKKLTRNIMLAAKVNDEYFMYGNLHIILKGNMILQVINTKECVNWFYKDKKQYNRLNKILGIDKLEALGSSNLTALEKGDPFETVQ